MANDNSQSMVILVFIMFVLVSIIGLGNPDDSTNELNESEFEIPIVSRSTELIALESEETITIRGIRIFNWTITSIINMNVGYPGTTPH